MLAQTLGGHLHLLLIFPVPVAIYLAARWSDGMLKARVMVILMAFTLAAQILLSIEIFVTATMFAMLVVLFALDATTSPQRLQTVRLVGMLVSAYALALLLVSPYVYYLFAYGQPKGQIWDTPQFSADLLNFVVPTELMRGVPSVLCESLQCGMVGISSNGRRISVRF